MGVGSYGGYARDFMGVVGISYLVLVAVALLLVWVLCKTQARRWVGSAVVLGFAALPVAALYSSRLQREARDKAEHEVYMQRYRPAKAIFDEKCKGAGLVVHRTVEGVEGILLLKTRPLLAGLEDYDPMFPGAAMAGDGAGKEYIYQFLFPESNELSSQLGDDVSPWPIRRGHLRYNGQHPGYQYVVAQDSDGIYYRHTVEIKFPPQAAPEVEFQKIRHEGPLPRYAVDFEDWVDPEVRRKHWVAGTTVRVIDTAHQEVMATLTRFRMSRTFGDHTQISAPWHFAEDCPKLVKTNNPSRYFVDQVAKPINKNLQ